MSAQNASDIDLAAADWVQRRQLWNWNEADQAAFDAWLEESDKHRIAFLRQNAVWESAGRLVVLRPELEVPAKARISPLLMRIAAVALVAALGAGGVAYYMQPRDAVYSTPIGGQKTLQLADGSRIELNTNTVVRLSKEGDTRKVTLERGEAYFHIRHDAAHPFVVSAGDYRVTDLGTEFVVRRAPARVEVGLIKGGVRFDAANVEGTPQSALLTPGDVVVADANSMKMSKRPLRQLMTELSWRRGMLVFKDAMLEDAVAEFNRYNSEKIVLAGADVARLKINGTFKASSVELFTRSVQDLFGLTVTHTDNELVISQ